MPAGAQAPVGIFDSGVGGLSVLRPIRALLPAEDLLYFADAGYAPYGGKTTQQVGQRAQAITAFLLSRGIKAMVVACNTATAAAIDAIRSRYPGLPVVGVEPGLKPGAAATRSGKVGVLATESTIASQRFDRLRQQIAEASDVQFLCMPCPGLADQVEKAALDDPATAALVRQFVQPLIEQGADTLVLGCTHYPFVRELIQQAASDAGGADAALIDTGDAVARQLQRVLAQGGLLKAASKPGSLRCFTSGSQQALEQACAKLLNVNAPVVAVPTDQHCQSEPKFV